MPALFKDLRAWLSGLGTAALLMLGASILLATVSSLVAFSGWSPTKLLDEVGDLMLKDSRPSDRQIAAAPGVAAARAARAAAPAAPAPTLGATAGDRASSGHGPAPRSPGAAPRVDDAPGPPALPEADSVPVDASSIAPAPPAAAAPVPAAAPPGPRRLTYRVGQATKVLTRGLGGAVEPLDPQLGETLGGTGGALGGTVGSLDGTLGFLDGTVESLDATGKTLGGAVRGLGAPY